MQVEAKRAVPRSEQPREIGGSIKPGTTQANNNSNNKYNAYNTNNQSTNVDDMLMLYVMIIVAK